MASALLTAVGLGLLGLLATAFFGLQGTDVARHISYGIFSTMVMLLAHSMMMFYLIGKGKAVKDAMAEGHLTGNFYQRIAAIRKPVFSIGTVAMAVTIVTALLGASVDTGILPPIVHAWIAYGAIACNIGAIKIEMEALAQSSRVVDEVNHLLGVVTAPLIRLAGVVKQYGALRPLRIERLEIVASEQLAVTGLDQPGAEALINLITGATLPDTGTVDVFGTSTSSIADSAAWLPVLDRFGLVTDRAALLDGLSVVQNLAMPFSLDIDPPPAPNGDRARALAREVAIDEACWERPVGALGASARLRMRLARALALDPLVLLCEHPSATLPRAEVGAFGRDLHRIATRRGLAMLAITADREFARAAGARVLAHEPATGRLKPPGWFR